MDFMRDLHKIFRSMRGYNRYFSYYQLQKQFYLCAYEYQSKIVTLQETST